MNAVILVGTIESVNFNGKGIAKMKVLTKTGYDRAKKEDRTAIVPVTAFSFEEDTLAKMKTGVRVCIQGIVGEYQRKFDGNVICTADVKVFPSGFSFI